VSVFFTFIASKYYIAAAYVGSCTNKASLNKYSFKFFHINFIFPADIDATQRGDIPNELKKEFLLRPKIYF